MKLKLKYFDPTDASTLINRGTGKHVIADGMTTIPVYKGKLYSIQDVVNKDGTVNVRKAKKIMEEVAEYFGGKKMQNRPENPVWHKEDPNTWLHTKKVAKLAWDIPVPEGYTKQDLMIAALGHDFGKIISGDGHAEVSYNLIKQIFPDATERQLNAIRKHMNPIQELAKGAAKIEGSVKLKKFEEFGKNLKRFKIVDEGKEVGEVEVLLFPRDKTIKIGSITAEKGKGYGLKTYEAISKLFPDYTLTSDAEALSDDAVKMWERLTAKGKAEKLGDKNYRYFAEPDKLMLSTKFADLGVTPTADLTTLGLNPEELKVIEDMKWFEEGGTINYFRNVPKNINGNKLLHILERYAEGSPEALTKIDSLPEKTLNMLLERSKNNEFAIDIYRQRMNNGGTKLVKERGTKKYNASDIRVFQDSGELRKYINELDALEHPLPDVGESWQKELLALRHLYADAVMYPKNTPKDLAVLEQEIKKIIREDMADYQDKDLLFEYVFTPDSPKLKRYKTVLQFSQSEMGKTGFADENFIWAPNKENMESNYWREGDRRAHADDINYWQTTLPHEFEHAYQNGDLVYLKFFQPKHAISAENLKTGNFTEDLLKAMYDEMEDKIGIRPTSLFGSSAEQLYLSTPTELLARGTQIKNWLGITNPKQALTAKDIEEAKEFYVATGVDNNMTSFLASIVDPEKAAKFLSYATMFTGAVVLPTAVATATSAKMGGNLISKNSIGGEVLDAAVKFIREGFGGKNALKKLAGQTGFGNDKKFIDAAVQSLEKISEREGGTVKDVMEIYSFEELRDDILQNMVKPETKVKTPTGNYKEATVFSPLEVSMGTSELFGKEVHIDTKDLVRNGITESNKVSTKKDIKEALGTTQTIFKKSRPGEVTPEIERESSTKGMQKAVALIRDQEIDKFKKEILLPTAKERGASLDLQAYVGSHGTAGIVERTLGENKELSLSTYAKGFARMNEATVFNRLSGDKIKSLLVHENLGHGMEDFLDPKYIASFNFGNVETHKGDARAIMLEAKFFLWKQAKKISGKESISPEELNEFISKVPDNEIKELFAILNHQGVGNSGTGTAISRNYGKNSEAYKKLLGTMLGVTPVVVAGAAVASNKEGGVLKFLNGGTSLLTIQDATNLFFNLLSPTMSTTLTVLPTAQTTTQTPDSANLNTLQLESAIKTNLNIPYVWGGKSKKGTDCTGFVDLVFKELGYENLQSGVQANLEKLQSVSIDKMLPGDIIMLKGTNPKWSKDRYSHAAVFLGYEPNRKIKVAEAAGGKSQIRTWPIDKGYYKDHWMGVKRMPALATVKTNKEGGTLKFQLGGILELGEAFDDYLENTYSYLPDADVAKIFDADLTKLFYLRKIKYGQLTEKAEDYLQSKYNLSAELLSKTLEELQASDLAQCLTFDSDNYPDRIVFEKLGGILKASFGSALHVIGKTDDLVSAEKIVAKIARGNDAAFEKIMERILNSQVKVEDLKALLETKPTNGSILIPQNPKYKPAVLTKPGVEPDTFNGIPLTEITSPSGSKIKGKFFTELGSEYIIAEDGATRRIKSSHSNTGGTDIGLHDWQQKAFFTKGEAGKDFNMAGALLKEAGVPFTIAENEGKLTYLIYDGLQWRTAMMADVYPNAVQTGARLNIPIATEFTNTPEVGTHILEVNTKNRIVSSIHPGSDVTFVESAEKVKSTKQVAREKIEAVRGKVISPNQIPEGALDFEHNWYFGHGTDTMFLPSILETGLTGSLSDTAINQFFIGDLLAFNNYVRMAQEGKGLHHNARGFNVIEVPKLPGQTRPPKDLFDYITPEEVATHVIDDRTPARFNLFAIDTTFKKGGKINKYSVGAAIKKFAKGLDEVTPIAEKAITKETAEQVFRTSGTSKVIGKATTEHLQKVATATGDKRILVLADFAVQCRDKGIKLPEEFNKFVDSIFKTPTVVSSDTKKIRVGKEKVAEPEVIEWHGLKQERPTFEKTKRKTKTVHTGEFKDKLEFKRTIPLTEQELAELSPKVDEAINSLVKMMNGEKFKLTDTMMDEIYFKSKGMALTFGDNRANGQKLRQLFSEIEYPTLVKRLLSDNYVSPASPSSELDKFYLESKKNIDWYRKVKNKTQKYIDYDSEWEGPLGNVEITPLKISPKRKELAVYTKGADYISFLPKHLMTKLDAPYVRTYRATVDGVPIKGVPEFKFEEHHSNPLALMQAEAYLENAMPKSAMEHVRDYQKNRTKSGSKDSFYDLFLALLKELHTGKEGIHYADKFSLQDLLRIKALSRSGRFKTMEDLLAYYSKIKTEQLKYFT